MNIELTGVEHYTDEELVRALAFYRQLPETNTHAALLCASIERELARRNHTQTP